MIKHWLTNHRKTTAFWLGVFSASALPPFYFLPILFIAMPMLLGLLDQCKTKKQAFATGYWYGFGYFAINLSWIGNALLIDAQTFGWLYPITVLASGAFFGLFVAFPTLLSYLFKNRFSRWLSFAAWWVIFEWIRSFIFTGFPWNMTGSVLAFHLPLIQGASLFGTYGLSLLILLTAAAPWLAIKAPSKNNILISCAIIICIATFLYGFGCYRLTAWQPTPSEVRIRLVQPAIPQSMKWNKQALEDNLKQYITLSTARSLDNIDFVIWGETASPFPLDYDLNHLLQISQAVPPQGYLITGSIRYEFSADGTYHPLNSMFVIDSNGKIAAVYDKSHLVPFGEYIPLKKYLPENIRPIAQSIADFKAGNGPKTINLNNMPSFGGLICYEIIFPRQICNKQNPPQWLVNLTNDGWYGDSQGPYQHLVTTRLRAVEEGKTIIRSANSGISAVISPYGETLASLPLNQKGTLDYNLPKQICTTTLYGKFGNIIPLFLSMLCLCFAFISNQKNKAQRR